MCGVVVGIGVQRGPLRLDPDERVGTLGTGGKAKKIPIECSAGRRHRGPKQAATIKQPHRARLHRKADGRTPLKSLKPGEKSKSSQAHKLGLSHELASHGKGLSARCRAAGVEIKKVPSEVWGEVNVYPVEMIQTWFGASTAN